MLRDLERTKQRYWADELEIYFDDIVDASERIWDMLENYKEVVEALEDTNESVISHRVNDILRVLTAFSVVVLPLTFIASLWGMNVGVPGEGDIAAFWIIVGRHGRAAGRDGGVLPPPRLALRVGLSGSGPAGDGGQDRDLVAVAHGVSRPSPKRMSSPPA